MISISRKKILPGFYWLALFGFFLCTGCSSTMYRRGEYLASYHQGQFSQTEHLLTHAIQNEMPNHDYRESGEAVWLLLDRATTRFAAGNIEQAIDDYRQAIEAMDFYSQDLTTESLAKVLLQDEMGAYPAEDFEQVLSRVYLALALLHQGDLSNASAILRQGEELQQRKREFYSQNSLTDHYQLIDNAVGKYLLAAVLEKRGDLSNADILYRQSYALANEKIINSPGHTATVLILCHNGNAPYKISATSDASIASAVALELFLGCHQIPPSLSSLGGVPAPELCNWFMSNPSPIFATVNGQQVELTPWYNVARTAHEQLEQKMPVIVARAVARYLIRRSAVACAQEQNPNLGALVDIGMLIANATTKADTRTWSTLPSFIDLARFDLNPGNHLLTLQLPNSDQQYSILLKQNDLCVINIFNIHPGVTTVQIPERFIQQNEK